MQIFVVAYILRIYLRDINRNSIYNKTLVFIAKTYYSIHCEGESIFLSKFRRHNSQTMKKIMISQSAKTFSFN